MFQNDDASPAVTGLVFKSLNNVRRELLWADLMTLKVGDPAIILSLDGSVNHVQLRMSGW